MSIFRFILTSVLFFNLSLNSGLANALLDNSNDILHPDKAFQLDVLPDTNNQNTPQIAAHWEVQSGYYLYQEKLQFWIDDKLIKPLLPDNTKTKKDEFFGESKVYVEPFTVYLLADWFYDGNNFAKELKIRYQGCAEVGVCYPPQTKKFAVADLKINEMKRSMTNQTTAIPTQNTANANNGNEPTIVSEADELLDMLHGQEVWLVLALFFVAGLLLAFTPCVLPMLPILSGIIAKQGDQMHSKKGFSISLAYVLSMSITYAIIGVIAGLLGENLQQALQTPAVLISFATLFIILALSMFGIFELQLPNSWQTRLNQMSNKQEGRSSIIGVVIMGFLSALVVGPCVAPPLAGALLYIGQTGDALLGGSALFLLGLGMGAPLLIFGTMAGKWLPKAGAWMETVKQFFGVLMLIIALWMLDRILPGWFMVLTWAIFLIILSAYMGAFKTAERLTSWHSFRQGIALITFATGVILLLSFMTGGSSILQPFRHIQQTGNSLNNGLSANIPTNRSFFTKTTTGDSLQQQLTTAKQQPIMLYVTADWCVTCKELDIVTFQNAQVINAMQGAGLALKIDVTENTDEDQAFQRKNQLVGPPAILFMDKDFKELRQLRIIGMVSPEDFIRRINIWKN